MVTPAVKRHASYDRRMSEDSPAAVQADGCGVIKFSLKRSRLRKYDESDVLMEAWCHEFEGLDAMCLGFNSWPDLK